MCGFKCDDFKCGEFECDHFKYDEFKCDDFKCFQILEKRGKAFENVYFQQMSRFNTDLITMICLPLFCLSESLNNFPNIVNITKFFNLHPDA